jgi:hypothetical protein
LWYIFIIWLIGFIEIWDDIVYLVKSVFNFFQRNIKEAPENFRLARESIRSTWEKNTFGVNYLREGWEFCCDFGSDFKQNFWDYLQVAFVVSVPLVLYFGNKYLGYLEWLESLTFYFDPPRHHLWGTAGYYAQHAPTVLYSQHYVEEHIYFAWENLLCRVSVSEDQMWYEPLDRQLWYDIYDMINAAGPRIANRVLDAGYYKYVLSTGTEYWWRDPELYTIGDYNRLYARNNIYAYTREQYHYVEIKYWVESYNRSFESCFEGFKMLSPRQVSIDDTSHWDWDLL